MSYASRRLRQFAPAGGGGGGSTYTLPGNYRIVVTMPGGLSLTNVPPDSMITVNRGTDFPLVFAVVNTDSTPFDLTGYGAVWTVKAQYKDLDSAALILKSSTTAGGITIPTPTNGVILVSLAEADTAEAYPYPKFPTYAARKHSLKLFGPGNVPGIPAAQGPFTVKDFGVGASTMPT